MKEASSSLPWPSVLYEHPLWTAVTALLVFSTLYHTYQWLHSTPRPPRLYLQELLRSAHAKMRASERALRHHEKKRPSTLQEWKLLEHELQRALLALDSLHRDAILETHATKFPADPAHDSALFSFSRRERETFDLQFLQLKQKRKLLVDRYLKALAYVDTKISQFAEAS